MAGASARSQCDVYSGGPKRPGGNYSPMEFTIVKKSRLVMTHFEDHHIQCMGPVPTEL